MITDASFASIAEHAALKALLPFARACCFLFWKGGNRLGFRKRGGHEQTKQFFKQSHCWKEADQFLDVPRLNALAVEGLHLVNPIRSTDGKCIYLQLR